MALSNIFNEPRREVTETVLGCLVLAICVAVAWKFGKFFQFLISDKSDGAMFFGTFLGLLIFPLVFGFLVFIHFIGEVVCDLLADVNLDLRPKRR